MSASNPPPPAANQPAPQTSTAGLGMRFLARFLDGLIIAIPVGILLGVLNLGDSYAVNALLSLGYFGYYVYFESTTGATLGKRITKLRVVSADGTPPSTENAAKRNVWMLFGLIPTFIGGLISFVAVVIIAVTISTNEYNRGKHDEFAGTGVLR